MSKTALATNVGAVAIYGIVGQAANNMDDIRSDT